VWPAASTRRANWREAGPGSSSSRTRSAESRRSITKCQCAESVSTISRMRACSSSSRSNGSHPAGDDEEPMALVQQRGGHLRRGPRRSMRAATSHLTIHRGRLRAPRSTRTFASLTSIPSTPTPFIESARQSRVLERYVVADDVARIRAAPCRFAFHAQRVRSHISHKH